MGEIVFSQTTTMNDNVTFSTTNQNMWGPGLGFSLDKNIPIIPQQNFGGPPSTYGSTWNILGGTYGISLQAGLWGGFGSNFYIKDVTGGSVDVTYPIQTNITYPSINTINKGEWITINTSYNVRPGWQLKTYFPTTGSMGIDFNFNFGVKFKPNICLGSCFSPFDLDFDAGVNFDIFKISANEVIYPVTTSAYTPTCLPPPYFCDSPLNLPTGPTLPALGHQNGLPFSYPSNKLGLSGDLDIPFVTTTDALQANKCLTATGMYEYFKINLDVIKFMSNYIPPPVGPLMSQLSGSYGGGPFYLNYNLLSADFSVNNTTHQNFNFCPTIKSNFHFVTPVFFEEITPGGTVVNTGQAQNITIVTGNNLRVKYPCNYEYIDVNVDYDLENQFSNHTYDEIGVNFILSSMDFNMGMSAFTIIPGGCIDPCFWGSCQFCWPSVGFPGFSFGTGGPLVSVTLPIASIPYDWYNGTWELGGFTNQNGGNFTLDAMPYLAQSTTTPVDCYGDNTGAMQVNVTNGVPPFNYIWSDGTITTSSNQIETYSNFYAGPASVVVEDANGCQAVTTQLITEPAEALYIINTSIKNIDCNGNLTGEISFDVYGGTPPYTYSWSNTSSTSNSATNLGVGNYSVTIIDAKGCSISQNFTITEPTPLNAYVTVNSNVLCKGGDEGSATIYPSGGTYPFSYLWSNSDNNQTANQLTAGNYNCTVTDINGCQITIPTTITEPSLDLQLSISQTPLTCYNNSTGQINLSVVGGTSPYNFNWYNQANQMLSQHVEDPVNLPADNYLVNVTDTNGCFDTISVQVTQPNELIISSYNITDVLCYGDNTGVIDITTIGGTIPYNFNWSNGNITEDNTNLLAGNYQVNITDNNGCSYSQSFDVIQPNEPLAATSVNTNVLCFGDNTGEIDLTVNGGTPPYNYVWNTSQTTEDISNLVANNYTATITDNHNCQLIYNTAINQPLAPLSSANSVVNVSCYGLADGEIINTTTGGTVPYFYQWNNSANVILADTTAHPQNLTANVYNLILTDNNGCQVSSTATITQPDSLIISFSTTDVLCKNDFTGAIDATINGGTTPYLYNWNSGQTTQDISNINAGVYTLNVTDYLGCTTQKTTEIFEPDEVLVVEVVKQDVKCKDDSTGVANAVVSGGVSPYQINWSNGENTALIDTLQAGMYTVTVTDNHNCVANSGTIINEPSTNIGFGISITDASCYNALDGIIELTPNGGITPYQLVFGDTLLNSYNNIINSYVLDSLHQGTYFARIIDGNGCEFDSLITVNQPDSLMLSGVVTDALCFGSQDGMVDLTVTGGTIPYNYMWSDSSTNQNLTNVYSGWYNVEVTDDHLCLTTATFFIDQPEEIIIKGTITEPTCRDNEDGTISIYVTGGIPGYDYIWSNNEITETIYDLAPGTYTIEVYDQHNCLKTDTFTVNPSIIDCINPPTAFTPDNDGINDTWVLDNINNYPNAIVQVYNKWGNLLYETTNGSYTPWDGYYEGRRLPSATYYYIINLNNGDAPYTGPVTIVINE
jgi:gliding motility-associated-like protein